MPANDAYIELCHLTTEIVDKARADGATEYTRAKGFREACRQRPDLASRAVGFGENSFVANRLKARVAAAEESPLVRACKEMSCR